MSVSPVRAVRTRFVVVVMACVLSGMHPAVGHFLPLGACCPARPMPFGPPPHQLPGEDVAGAIARLILRGHPFPRREEPSMSSRAQLSRRRFLRRGAGLAGAAAASTVFGVPAVLADRAPNEKLGIAVIG